MYDKKHVCFHLFTHDHKSVLNCLIMRDFKGQESKLFLSKWYLFWKHSIHKPEHAVVRKKYIEIEINLLKYFCIITQWKMTKTNLQPFQKSITRNTNSKQSSTNLQMDRGRFSWLLLVITGHVIIEVTVKT